MTQKFTITETLTRTLEISGSDSDDCVEKLKQMYDEGKIKFESGFGSKDFKKVEIEQVS